MLVEDHYPHGIVRWYKLPFMTDIIFPDTAHQMLVIRQERLLDYYRECLSSADLPPTSATYVFQENRDVSRKEQLVYDQAL